MQPGHPESLNFPGDSNMSNMQTRLRTTTLGLGLPRWLSSKESAMQGMQFPSLGREGPPEKEMATHSSVLAWETPMDRGAWWPSVHGVTKSWSQLSDYTVILGLTSWVGSLICPFPATFYHSGSQSMVLGLA